MYVCISVGVQIQVVVIRFSIGCDTCHGEKTWALDHVDWMHVWCCLFAQTTFAFSQVWKVKSCEQANSIRNLHSLDGVVEGAVVAMLCSDFRMGYLL